MGDFAFRHGIQITIPHISQIFWVIAQSQYQTNVRTITLTATYNTSYCR